MTHAFFVVEGSFSVEVTVDEHNQVISGLAKEEPLDDDDDDDDDGGDDDDNDDNDATNDDTEPSRVRVVLQAADRLRTASNVALARTG